MNNHSNMNYMLNNPYLNQSNPNLNSMKPNMMNTIGNDQKLKQKLAMQAGDNMNFNVSDYNQSLNPNKLYDFYEGFIRGNMFPDLYNQYKVTGPFDIAPKNEEEDLLTYIDAYSFAAHEMNLYLDNNPNDRDMIEAFKKYTNEANKYINEYEKKYGPLFVDASTTYPWAWNESPWPWEGR